jgi:alpha-L-fucosidase
MGFSWRCREDPELLHFLLAVALSFYVVAFSSAAHADIAVEMESPPAAFHNPVPDWFRDAKLGIYFHWGVYSVPAYSSEWYPRNMHALVSFTLTYFHHRWNYGPPSTFGYHDFVPLFTAGNFDAAEWADLFARSGARFAGLVAEHHDGFAMWDSQVTPWNTVDMGPGRDITGELEKEIRARGMKFVTTFHHARNLQRYRDIPNGGWNLSHLYHRWKNNEVPIVSNRWSDSHYPYIAGSPPASEDPQLRLLYGNMPEEEWLERMWLGKLKEVVDAYQPDLIYFDSWLHLIPLHYRERFVAYYLEQARTWGREVVITRKQNDLPLDYSINDFEKGRAAELTEESWLTDDTISSGSWSYTEDLEIKSLREVLHNFIDIISKNGQLMLNISPMSDGTIPENQREVLLNLGDWLGKYGEAIYGSRPFLVYGEGPNHLKEGGHFVEDIDYTAQDIRYTRNGDTVYAIILGRPKFGTSVTLNVFGQQGAAANLEPVRLSLLASEAELIWSRDAAGLTIQAPQEWPDPTANVLRMDFGPG